MSFYDELINIIKFNMESAEALCDNVSGRLKKRYVMDMVKMEIINKYGQDFYSYDELTSSLIELIIDGSKNNLNVDVNVNKKKSCLNCFKK